MKYSLVLQIILFVLPWKIRKFAYRKLFKWDIADNCFIGRTIINSQKFTMGFGASVGNLNYIRGLDIVELKSKSSIGNLNWITSTMGMPTSHLYIGEESAITNRHYIDCNGGVEIGCFSTVAGVGSKFFSHAIDLKSSRQAVSLVKIGSYCFVGTGCIFLPGSILPDYSVIGAGSTMYRSRSNSEPLTHGLYIGNPAVRVKSLDRELMYFQRTSGKVS